MTLLITAAAAIIAALARKWTLALVYCGAALMWCVDGFASVLEGGPFIELADAAQMADDALLGIVVVAVGLAVWAAYRIAKSVRAR